MKKKLLIRDVSLRDGQQSLLATRMSQAQVDRALQSLLDCNFFAMEVWGGAVPDAIMRYLHENPWERLEKIKAVARDRVKLTALSRGRNLFGYNPYPDHVIEGFCKHSIESGIDIMRIFDALNDTNNIQTSIGLVKKYGGLADATICYTVDPKYTTLEKVKAIFHAKSINTRIFTKDYFVEKAKVLQEMGADMISLKDMAGLITPGKTGRLIKMLKSELHIPVNFHTHCTPGNGLASTLMAIINGVDVVDTALWNFAGGPAAPPFEIIQIFCDKMNIETSVNIEATVNANKILRDIREEMKEYDSYPTYPKEFDITRDKLPPDIDRLVDIAIGLAKADKEDDLLAACHQLDRYFNFPPPDDKIRAAEIPGGMYTNMLAQLKQLKLEKLLPRTLELIPMVRLASGCPPLVTPTSQIIGVQAVNCAIDENKGQPFYTTKSIQFVNLVKGSYGKTPVPVNPEFRYKIAGVKEETPYDTRYYKKQENPVYYEYGDAPLAQNEKEELLLELFPSVAHEFLKKRLEEAYLAEIYAIEEEKERKLQEEKDKFNALTPQEKEERLLKGLYNYDWMTHSEDPIGLS